MHRLQQWNWTEGTIKVSLNQKARMNGRVGTWLMEQDVVLQQADGAACRELKRGTKKAKADTNNNYSPHSMWKGIKTTQQSLSDNKKPDALNQYFPILTLGGYVKLHCWSVWIIVAIGLDTNNNKVLQKLVLTHIKSVIPPDQDTHQFSYWANDSTEDAIATVLPTALENQIIMGGCY